MKKPAAKSPKNAKKERVMPILLLLRARVQQNLSRKIQNHLQQNFQKKQLLRRLRTSNLSSLISNGFFKSS